jgi:hypothetical protein
LKKKKKKKKKKRNTSVGCERFVWLRFVSIALLLGHAFEHKGCIRGGNFLTT